MPVNAAPRAHALYGAHTPNTSPLVARPTTRARSPPLRVVQITVAATPRVLASSSVNNTVSQGVTGGVGKVTGGGEGNARRRDPWCSLVYVVERRGSIVVVVVVVREQCGEPRAQRGLVRVWRDVPNDNDAAGAV